MGFNSGFKGLMSSFGLAQLWVFYVRQRHRPRFFHLDNRCRDMRNAMTDPYSSYHILFLLYLVMYLKKRIRILPSFVAMWPSAIRILGLGRQSLYSLPYCTICVRGFFLQPVLKFTFSLVTLPWCLSYLWDFWPVSNLQTGAYRQLRQCWGTSKSTNTKRHAHAHEHAHTCQELNAVLQILSGKTLNIHVVSMFVVTGLWTYFTKCAHIFVSHLPPSFTRKKNCSSFQ